MDADERRQYILDKLNKNGKISIADISSELNISRETIRKDIYALADERKLVAIRGGAVQIAGHVGKTKYGQRTLEHAEQKREIATKCLKLLSNDQTIFLDYGSTIVELARQIEASDLQNLTIVTDSLNVVEVFQYSKKHHIICLGGALRSEEGSFSGPLTLNAIDNLFCDTAFFGCAAISLEAGITNHYFNEIEVSQKMLKHSNKSYILADSSKFGHQALYKEFDFNEITGLITPSDFSMIIRETFAASGYSHLFF